MRALTELISPCSEHVLDWFHIAMRLTVLSQYTKGVAQLDQQLGDCLLADTTRIKWLLWHGNVHRAVPAADEPQDDVDALEVDYPHRGKFARAAHEFAVYIASNTDSIINYGERFRAGERISSGFVESAVNAVVSKRFAKKQQMQWTPRGAHLLLQVRARTLDGTLRSLFESWHPGLANDNQTDVPQADVAWGPHTSACSLRWRRRDGRRRGSAAVWWWFGAWISAVGVFCPVLDQNDEVDGARSRHRDVPQWSPQSATMRSAVHHAAYHDRS